MEIKRYRSDKCYLTGRGFYDEERIQDLKKLREETERKIRSPYTGHTFSHQLRRRERLQNKLKLIEKALEITPTSVFGKLGD